VIGAETVEKAEEERRGNEQHGGIVPATAAAKSLNRSDMGQELEQERQGIRRNRIFSSPPVPLFSLSSGRLSLAVASDHPRLGFSRVHSFRDE